MPSPAPDAAARHPEKSTPSRSLNEILQLNKDLQVNLQAMVEEGFEVYRALGLKEALEKARAAAPDVVGLAPPEPDWVAGLRSLPGQPALLALGPVSPGVPATGFAAVIQTGLAEPEPVLRAIKALDIVQRRRRTGRDRRQGLDRRRQPG